jgi:1,4-alpha-glucan branching enzyme
MHKLVLGKIYSIPGPKMIFQGDESANLSYFKFFRKFSIGPENYLRDKGYEPGLAAFLDSKLTSIKVCDKYSYINKAVEKYVSDLNLLNDNNIALTSGHIEKSFTFENTDIHAIYSRKIYNEIFSISNFSSVNYLKNYGIMFPKGKWREIFNSDDIKYAGTSEYLNKEEKYEQYSYISIPAYGIVFFEKII